VITLKIRLGPNICGDSAVTGEVSVGGDGVTDGPGEGVIVVRLGVSVGVAGEL